VADVFSVVEAFAVAEKLDGALLRAAEAALRQRGGAVDSRCPQLPPCSDALNGQPAPASAGCEGPRVLAAGTSLLALWKPPGWIVSVEDTAPRIVPAHGASECRGTPRLQDWVATEFAGRWPIAADAAASRGLLQRLDRETSGAVLWAGSYTAYYAARLQFAARRVRKGYLCLCSGALPPPPRLFQQPLREVPAAGGRAAEARVSPLGRPACTELAAAAHAIAGAGCCVSLASVRLHTGRLHQIRAHLADAGHPLVGDRVYRSNNAVAVCPRVFLHAAEAGVDAGGGPLLVALPLPEDLRTILHDVIPMDRRAVAFLGSRLAN